jgi:hypothetical protein
MFRPSLLSASLLIGALVLLPAGVGAVCSGVEHANLTIGPWEYDEFYAEGTSTPLTVSLEFTDVPRYSSIEYFDGSQWIGVTGDCTVEGTKTRIGDGVVVTIRYTFQSCSEIVQPGDS